MMTLQGLNKYQHAFEITFVLCFTYITLIQLVLTPYIGQQSDSDIIHVVFLQVKSYEINTKSVHSNAI